MPRPCQTAMENIVLTSESKVVLKHLVSKLVTSEVEIGKLENLIQQSETTCANLQKMLLEERKGAADAEAELKKCLDQVKHVDYEKIVSLLREVQQKEGCGVGISTSEREEQLLERLRSQNEELEKLKEINQELCEEVEALKQDLEGTMQPQTSAALQKSAPALIPPSRPLEGGKSQPPNPKKARKQPATYTSCFSKPGKEA